MKKICTGIKRFFNNRGCILSYPIFCPASRKKKGGGRSRRGRLLLAEGLAVGALIHGRILLMGAHQDLVQRAVVLSVAVISAGGDGAFDALVDIAVHLDYLLLFGFGFSMAEMSGIM